MLLLITVGNVVTSSPNLNYLHFRYLLPANLGQFIVFWLLHHHCMKRVNCSISVNCQRSST
jgi:hypothetical protein